MEYWRQALKWGAGFIALAAVLRLLSAGFFHPMADFLGWPELAGFFLYTETGHFIRFDPMPEETDPEATDSPMLSPEQGGHAFTKSDLVSVQYHCSYRPMLLELLQAPLTWDMLAEGPSVLIVHTHATETYTEDGIVYSGEYRTLDTDHNMVSIGEEVARVLRSGGVGVLHDKTLHDYPNYTGSYDAARQTIEDYLAKYPSIRMVLDIHRDASGEVGGEFITSATAGGQKTAQLMMVVGTQSETWQENLSLALKVSALLERTNPGICRPIDLRSERFNMDLSVGSMLVEVGATGNTHEEALIAANALAQAVGELIMGNG